MKRYRDYNTYLREIFGERVQKISLDAGMTCPNRDGTLSTGGCIFCDPRGSGTGAMTERGLSIQEQIRRSREFVRRRYGARKFIAYFQSFTNTYAPIPRLKTLYDQALSHDDMVGLSVATRPDCINPEVLRLLASYQENHLVWIEYGLQSAHDATLERINRGHDAACFERAVHASREYGLNVCAHIILGLPGETRDMIRQTARFLSRLPVQGIKIHLLYVVRGTPLARLYQKRAFRCLDRNTYAELVTDVLERLPPRMVVQRITGDPPGPGLLAPSWAVEKSANLKHIQEALERRDTWQGRLFRNSTAAACGWTG
ncbi:MAG: TIGR01212 family radical SAM protein [Deltaproteobacteria bacterium]|nr:MAG: TIGR01212 family radical SAM protein [Deltaproteobacteria bacterium]